MWALCFCLKDLWRICYEERDSSQGIAPYHVTKKYGGNDHTGGGVVAVGQKREKTERDINGLYKWSDV